MSLKLTDAEIELLEDQIDRLDDKLNEAWKLTPAELFNAYKRHSWLVWELNDQRSMK